MKSHLTAVVTASFLIGCSPTVPATEVLVEIDAEPVIRASARSIVIEVSGGATDALEVQHTETLSAPLEWPVVVAVTPLGGDATRRFSVSAEARDASGSLGRVQITSGFAAQRVLVARLLLEDCCSATRCGASETCRACACASATIDPGTLPDYVGGDAGMPMSDAPRADVGGDAGGCSSDAMCPPITPVCAAGACVECTATRTEACAAGEVCDPGSSTCVSRCAGDGDCDLGRICTAGACVEGCRVDRPCLGSATCCGDACVDLDEDPRHCGSCGMACGAGESCCDRACAAIESDIASCGACGNACGTANGAASCVSGSCGIACDATHDDCDGLNPNGCETDLRTLTDCGGCGTGCSVAHGAPSCASGVCAVLSCDPGFLDCDGVAANGCEAQVSIDPENCGGCGVRCAAPGATTACVDASCAVVTCTAGTGNCDGAAATGCETDTTSSFAHCGACGRSCTLRGTSRECRASDCVSLGCMPGFTDCNGGTDGCEAFVASDRNNCGGCGVACPGGQACDNGGCCPLGLGFCPGVGCVSTASDPNHCGGCGRVCAGTCFDYDCL
jgi:hypothetical protein